MSSNELSQELQDLVKRIDDISFADGVRIVIDMKVHNCKGEGNAEHLLAMLGRCLDWEDVKHREDGTKFGWKQSFGKSVNVCVFYEVPV